MLIWNIMFYFSGPGRATTSSLQVTKSPPFPTKSARSSAPPAQPPSGANTGHKSTFSALEEFRKKGPGPDRSGPGYYTLPNRNHEPYNPSAPHSGALTVPPDQTYFSEGPVPSVIPSSSEDQFYVYDPLKKSTYSVAKQSHQEFANDLYNSAKKQNTGQGAGFTTCNPSGNKTVENPFLASYNPNSTPSMFSERPPYSPNLGSSHDMSSGSSNYNPSSSMYNKSSNIHTEPSVGSYEAYPNNQYGIATSQGHGQHGNYNNNWQGSSNPQQNPYVETWQGASGHEGYNQPSVSNNQPRTYSNEQSVGSGPMTYSGRPTYTGVYTNVRK